MHRREDVERDRRADADAAALRVGWLSRGHSVRFSAITVTSPVPAETVVPRWWPLVVGDDVERDRAGDADVVGAGARGGFRVERWIASAPRCVIVASTFSPLLVIVEKSPVDAWFSGRRGDRDRSAHADRAGLDRVPSAFASPVGVGGGLKLTEPPGRVAAVRQDRQRAACWTLIDRRGDLDRARAAVRRLRLRRQVARGRTAVVRRSLLAEAELAVALLAISPSPEGRIGLGLAPGGTPAVASVSEAEPPRRRMIAARDEVAIGDRRDRVRGDRRREARADIRPLRRALGGRRDLRVCVAFAATRPVAVGVA